VEVKVAEVFIGGQFRRTDRIEPVYEAATGKLLGNGPSASAGDIDDAVTAARTALKSWKTTSAAERAQFLYRLADAMEARAEQTNQLCTRENGVPISYSRLANSALPVAMLRYYADLICEIDVEEIRPTANGHTVVRREPVGVVGAIAAWNVPQLLAVAKFAPALATGCTVVLKPAPETALDARVFGEAAAEAGLPPGVLNVVPGDDRAGAYLVRHSGVNMVAFTGSTRVGRCIAGTCGRLMRPITLELGGKSAAIILDDADLTDAVEQLRVLSFGLNGQMCYANSRVLAPRSRYGDVVDAITEMASSLVVGDPLDDRVEIGPLVSAQQRQRVLGYIEAGKAEGARIVTGGGVPTTCSSGWYVAPTVFVDVNNSARIAREEIFGPVLSVIPYDSDDEAVNIANDSEYGLGGTVFSPDEARAMEIARKVQTGTIGINHYQPELVAPFGGVKGSGLGREFGPEGLAAYQTVKSIYRVDAARPNVQSGDQ
jgi:aldehyde dehydrogenase (NAD+)